MCTYTRVHMNGHHVQQPNNWVNRFCYTAIPNLCANIPIMPAKPMLCLAYQSIRKNKVQLLLQPQLWQRVGKVSSVNGWSTRIPSFWLFKIFKSPKWCSGDGFVYRLITPIPSSGWSSFSRHFPVVFSNHFQTDHDRPMSQDTLPIRRQGAVSWRVAATCPPVPQMGSTEGLPLERGPVFEWFHSEFLSKMENVGNLEFSHDAHLSMGHLCMIYGS